MCPELGRIERVELRSVWTSEASGFTPWLAQKENLELLGKTLGIELEFEAQEQDVGPFRADILCKNTLDDSWVLIENQLEKTDHPHLGQLLTYAAGLKADTIVWIASSFRDEHRAVLDWLNEKTPDSVRFFGLEIELWQIGTSPAAPRFNIVCQPNDWSNNVAVGARRVEDIAITETQELQLKYWTHLSQHLSEHSHFQLRTPAPQNWADFAIGRTNATIRLSNNTQNRKVTAGVYLSKNMRERYDSLYTQREAIELRLGYALIWENAQNVQTAVIKVERPADISQEDGWKAEHEWLTKQLEELDRIFRPLLARTP